MSTIYQNARVFIVIFSGIKAPEILNTKHESKNFGCCNKIKEKTEWENDSTITQIVCIDWYTYTYTFNVILQPNWIVRFNVSSIFWWKIAKIYPLKCHLTRHKWFWTRHKWYLYKQSEKNKIISQLMCTHTKLVINDVHMENLQYFCVTLSMWNWLLSQFFYYR